MQYLLLGGIGLKWTIMEQGGRLGERRVYLSRAMT